MFIVLLTNPLCDKLLPSRFSGPAPFTQNSAQTQSTTYQGSTFVSMRASVGINVYTADECIATGW